MAAFLKMYCTGRVGLCFLWFYVQELPKAFCGFPWVETSTAGRVYDLCVYYMTEHPKAHRKWFFMWFYGFFMEKPGTEPATPGLQGIALIHYTTGASLLWLSLGRNQYRRECL